MDAKSKRFGMLGVAILIAIAGAYFYIDHLRYKAMHAIPIGLFRFDVTGPVPVCARWKEHMPKVRDPEPYQLYIDARNRWRSKIEWQFTKEELTQILADVRAASDKGDWGARALLAYFYRHGLGPLPKNRVLDPDADKTVAIARMAVKAGQPWGYYDVGVAHQYGYGGAYYDLDIAWAYYLKAAELGSPYAQMALAEAYSDAGRKDAEEQMLRCAYQQGHGPAATDLGRTARARRRFLDSLRFHHDAVKFGSKDSAVHLYLAFDSDAGASKWPSLLDELGIDRDPERYRRYLEIAEALDLNPDLRFSRLDSFLPLPPAELPEWRGIKDAMDPEPSGPPAY
ncbi:DUF6396 domain-containing protein [Massilia sp. Root418]|jgi:hypothetical protein|uniref:SEL1-like repeat protein n=1 Tax=Massilia sp. Root418 TaxID=1736532 RepID=UPI001E55A13C|nr:DUF6396 domain-containing protein [Massilia sp. Root418]